MATTWMMVTCVDRDTEVDGAFDSPEEWRAWLRANYPDMIDNPLHGFTADGEVTKQYGTDYRWSSLLRVED
jgi:hypothetical protein